MKPLRGTKAGKPMKVFVDKTGRTRAVVDHAAREAKMDLCTKIKRRSSKKVTVVKRGGK